nr:M15 family metallopeptidase [Psychromicrobium silvestre]
MGVLGLAACEGPDSSNDSGSTAAGQQAGVVNTVPAPGQKAPTAPANSLDDPRSIWVIVNKRRPLKPANYHPSDLVRPAVSSNVGGETAMLRAPAAAALEKMAKAAQVHGTPLTLVSGFRSYQTQVSTYGSFAAATGISGADHASARPGYSEHQTGLAVDIGNGGGCNLQPCFAGQPLAAWVAQNCHTFGFVVRYQLNFQDQTGYFAEPWHLRYVGVELATAVKKSGLHSLEQYFGLDPAPDYS